MISTDLTDINWEETTEERYDEMLSVLPPAFMEGGDFLVGEPETYRKCAISGNTSAVFDGFVSRREKFYVTSEAVTRLEFDKIRQEFQAPTN